MTTTPARCGARTRSGHPCRRAPAIGRERCVLHGGATPRGLALPQTTHGRHSRDLPTRLAGRYQEAANDPDRLRLDAEIVLVDTLINERLSTLDTGESGRIWKELREAWKLYVTSRSMGPAGAAGMSDALDQIEHLIQRGSADYGARQEIMELIERRRRLVDSEGKRRVAAREMMTLEEAALLIHTIGDSIVRNVPDPSARDAIARDIESFTR